MQERNQFTESIPVDDTTFRLTDGDWTDWTQSAAGGAAQAPSGDNLQTEGYDIVDI